MQNITLSHFLEQFGGRASSLRLAEAPGRVNLIGDHTDYNGLPVFPMAVQRRFRILFRPRPDNLVRLASTDGFALREFALGDEIDPFSQGDWGNYVKASARILAHTYGIRAGIDALFHSDIPVAAGLSSSSALVVGSGLALLDANGLKPPFEELVEVFPEGERYVGTRGGAMDHTICLAGRPGFAIKIDFDPFALHPVRVPDGWCFLIGHSLVRAEKSSAVKEQYNERREACRRRDPRRWGHVVTEAARVEGALQAMQANDMETFGRLMNESHASLRDGFEVSHPEVDELVEAFIAAGAAGARVTGAGFGGCVVALCRRDRKIGVRDSVEQYFYRHRPNRALFPEYLLEAEPSAGARVIDFVPAP